MSIYTDTELLLLCNLLQLRKRDVPSKGKKKIIESPFKCIWKDENIGVSIEEMLEHIDVELLRSNKVLAKYSFDGMITGERWADMIEAIRASKIKRLKLKKIEIDDKDAMNAYFEDEVGNGYVVFRGTGSGEWKDNFTGGYETDTEQQKRALHFVSSIQKDELIAVGHSKGGNKAKYVALMSNKVVRCVSFDGQGFSQDFIEKYQDRIVKNKYKIQCYALDNDFVNILLFDIYKDKIFLQGSDITNFAQNHGSDSMFTFIHDESGHVTGCTFRPSKQGWALKTFHEFVNYIANKAKPQERKRLFNFLGDIAQMALGQKDTGEPYEIEEIEKYIKKPKNILQLVIFLNYIREYEFHGNKISDAVIDIMTNQLGNHKNEELFKMIKSTLAGISKVHFVMFESYKVLLGWQYKSHDEEYDMTQNEVVRDFSDEKREMLLELTDEVSGEKIWEVSKWDIWYRAQQHLGLLKEGDTIEKSKIYYRKLIDIHGTTHEQMQEMFDKIDRIESIYCEQLQEHIAKMKEIKSKMKMV